MTQQGKAQRAEQIVEKLGLAEALSLAGKSKAEICQQLGISPRTLYLWKELYGGMHASEAKRLRVLEQENRRLKQLLAEAELDKAILKEAARGNW